MRCDHFWQEIDALRQAECGQQVSHRMTPSGGLYI